MSTKKNSPMLPPNEIVFYETENGKISIAVKFENENIWLTQKHMAELFEVDVRTISEHLQNIFSSAELIKDSVIRKLRNTATDGKSYSTQFYSLEAVVAIGYRVNSERGIAFRTWATDKLKNYIFKGFAIDSKIPANRAHAAKPNMGLTTWRKAPDGKIFLSDATIAKNYLSKDELSQLNRIVNMYIDYAEFQAARGKVMATKDWTEKLDVFLQYNEQEILSSLGRVSHEVAVALVENEYNVFRETQDQLHKSDFDKLCAASKLVKSND